MELTGKKVLIFVGPDFEDREFVYPLYRLKEAGAQVVVAGLGEKMYKGKYGIPVEPDGSCDDYVNAKFDAVIVPGGWAPDKIRANEAALEIVRKAVSKGAVVAAICHGGWVLASADVCKGKTMTSYKNIKDDLIHAGANWVDKEVVVDGGIVTSRTPTDLPAFMREVVKAMQASPVGH